MKSDRPLPERVLARDELIMLARRLHVAEGTERELDEVMDQLEKELPHGDIITLLFKKEPELTVEAAIDEALHRQAMRDGESI